MAEQTCTWCDGPFEARKIGANRKRFCSAQAIVEWLNRHPETGARWALDSPLDAFDRARAICRTAASEADNEHVKKALASAKTVAAVERLAKADTHACIQHVGSPGTINGGDRQYPLWRHLLSANPERKHRD